MDHKASQGMLQAVHAALAACLRLGGHTQAALDFLQTAPPLPSPEELAKLKRVQRAHVNADHKPPKAGGINRCAVNCQLPVMMRLEQALPRYARLFHIVQNVLDKQVCSCHVYAFLVRSSHASLREVLAAAAAICSPRARDSDQGRVLAHSSSPRYGKRSQLCCRTMVLRKRFALITPLVGRCATPIVLCESPCES